MEKLIEKLEERIREIPKKYMNDVSWGMQEGILISGSEAKKLLSFYEFYKSVMDTNGVENNKDICDLSKKLKSNFK